MKLYPGDSVSISKTITHRFGISNCQYLVLSVSQHAEAFPCVIINDHGALFYFAEYEII